MSWEIWLAYLATVAVFFVSPPGPSQMLMIGNSLRHGLARSTATMAGDLSANALQMTAAAFGLAGAVAAEPALFEALKWAGVAWLGYLGIRAIRNAGRLDETVPEPAASRGALWRQGFFTSAANPQAVLFFAALFPQFVDPGAPIWPQLLVLGGTYILIDGALLLAWGGLATRLLQGLARRRRLLGRISGSAMLAAALLLSLRAAE
jgi:threonine/homoserine/homoserine lactone efflux protein